MTISNYNQCIHRKQDYPVLQCLGRTCTGVIYRQEKILPTLHLSCVVLYRIPVMQLIRLLVRLQYLARRVLGTYTRSLTIIILSKAGRRPKPKPATGHTHVVFWVVRSYTLLVGTGGEAWFRERWYSERDTGTTQRKLTTTENDTCDKQKRKKTLVGFLFLLFQWAKRNEHSLRNKRPIMTQKCCSYSSNPGLSTFYNPVDESLRPNLRPEPRIWNVGLLSIFSSKKHSQKTNWSFLGVQTRR